MKISIIIPTYNRATLLRDSVDSVVEFVVCDFEILVCDDGSTDDTESVCAEYAAKGVEMVYTHSEERLGAQVARNRGLRQASGDAVMFMDSDDALAGPGIMELVDALERDPELGYAYGKVVKTDSNLKPFDPVRVTGSVFEMLPRELAGYHWHTMGALYRKSALDSVGLWNPELTGSQDWEYQARVKLYGGRGEFVDSLVGLWRQHDGERVGATGFRPDYVRSVMKASQSILTHARKAGICDASLERRLAKRLIVHALEWGAHGYGRERKNCLMQASESLSNRDSFRMGIRLLAHLPRTFDRRIWQVIVGRSLRH